MKRAINLHDFPCRPRRFESESLVGYLYRLMSANGHHISAGGHYREVRLLYAWDLAHSKEILRELALFIDEPSYQADRFWDERSLLLQSNLKPRSLSFPKLRANSPWFCIACMREHAFHREYWVMPLARTCPVHGLFLTACCGVCNAVLQWSTLRDDWKCSRGHTIYDAQSIPATKPSIPRDQLVATHTHFGLENKVISSFDQYRRDATIHEIYIAYYWVLSPGRVDDEWGLKSAPGEPKAEGPTLSGLKSAFDCPATLSYAFVRWAYLWRIIMSPLGRHVPIPISLLNHVVRRRPPSADAPSKAKSSKREKRRSSSRTIEFLYEHRVLQLRRILVYLNDQVPSSIGLSALHQFNRWWPETVLEARKFGLMCRGNAGVSCKHTLCNVKDSNTQVQIEITVTTLLDRLLFCACMLFTANDLKRFWACFILPRSLPGSSRRTAHKRLAAYLMTRPLDELSNWNTQIEADLQQLHQGFCDELT
ncbi:TniQ family protein [Advenella sp. FME57]|uniref:TniQ family protein n=1 Tax=Advenella sp. FME57 TaxID=2742604 RepID=UPI001865E9EF|nr:TniQ family protein [Advenella sp. FME57]